MVSWSGVHKARTPSHAVSTPVMVSLQVQGGGTGAGDGIRTRDILLGKQTLCQLSYSRSAVRILRRVGRCVKRPISSRREDQAMPRRTSVAQLGTRTAERLTTEATDELRSTRLA